MLSVIPENTKQDMLSENQALNTQGQRHSPTIGWVNHASHAGDLGSFSNTCGPSTTRNNPKHRVWCRSQGPLGVAQPLRILDILYFLFLFSLSLPPPPSFSLSQSWAGLGDLMDVRNQTQVSCTQNIQPQTLFFENTTNSRCLMNIYIPWKTLYKSN